MSDILRKLSIVKLYDLRDYINCSDDYDLTIKQQLMDDITSEIRLRNLEELMKPIVKDFIKEQEDKYK